MQAPQYLRYDSSLTRRNKSSPQDPRGMAVKLKSATTHDISKRARRKKKTFWSEAAIPQSLSIPGQHAREMRSTVDQEIEDWLDKMAKPGAKKDETEVENEEEEQSSFSFDES